MATVFPTPTTTPVEAATVRRIGVADLGIALRRGYADFLERRGDIAFLVVLYPLAGLLTALFMLNQNAIQFLFPAVAGAAMFGPAAASVFYEVAKRRARGEDASWAAAFGVLRGASFDALVTVTGVLGVVFVAWLITAWAIYAVTLGPEPPQSAATFLRDVLGTPAGWTLIVAGNLAGLFFATLAMAIGVVSFPMIVDRPVAPAVALATSFRAVRRNPVTMLLWGAIVGVLLLAGALLLLVGLAVVLPVLGYATWHLYTLVVER